MAWLDDRVWCHPKLTDISDGAFRAWVNGMAYSSGFGTRGILTAGQQRKVGADAKRRRELVSAGLWDEVPEGVAIHDWDEHNGKRDARRAADRERKKLARSGGASAGQSAGASNGLSLVAARVEGSDGSEKELLKSPAPPAAGLSDSLWRKLLLAAGARDPASIAKVVRTMRGHQWSEADVAGAIEACTGPGVRDPLAVALSELKKRRAA